MIKRYYISGMVYPEDSVNCGDSTFGEYCTSDDVEKLEKENEELKRNIQIICPYIIATIDTQFETRENWIEIHKGRAFSSINRLKKLMSLVKEE